MRDNKLMKFIIVAMILGVLGFAYYLYVADWKNPKATFIKEEPQPYVTAVVDTTITRRKLYTTDSVKVVLPTMQQMVAKLDTDSMVVNLHRPLQEVVTIDMEDHTEPLFFTWEDLKSYYQVVVDYFANKKKE